MNDASTRPSLRQDESSGTFTWVGMSFTYTSRRSSGIGQSPVLRYSLSCGHRQEAMLAATLSFLSTQTVHPAPFNGDSDGSTPKTPTISDVVSISSSGTIVAQCVTSRESSSFLFCGTRREFYTHADVDEHYDNLALSPRA